MTTTYRAGAPWHPSTMLPSNVTGECSHQHRSVAAAERCIASHDSSIKNGHGRNASSDRSVMVEHDFPGGRHQLGAGCSVCGAL